MKSFDWNFCLSTDVLTIKIEKGERSGYYVRFRKGESVIICPRTVDFSESDRQVFFYNAIVEILRKQAKIYLTPRIIALSESTGLKFQRLTIKRVHSKWGSCSSLNNINLSLFLMLLPSHLIDYVILHELCHIREKNHGQGFWALLDSFTSGKAKVLRKELNTYRSTSSIGGARGGGLVRVIPGKENEEIL